MEGVHQTKTPSKPHKTPLKEAKTTPPRPAFNDANSNPSANINALLDEEIVPNPHLFDVFLRLRPTSRKTHENPRFLSTIPTQPTNVYVTPPPAKSPVNTHAPNATLTPLTPKGSLNSITPKGSLNQLTPGRGSNDDKYHAISPRSPKPREAAKAKAIEKFRFTEILPENSSQRDVFGRATVPLLIETIGGRINTTEDITNHGRDCLLTTMGIAGSGKTYTTLGNRAQWGMVQMTLKVLFDAVGNTFYPYSTIWQHLRAGDNSHATITDIDGFLETMSQDMNAHLQQATEAARQATEPDIKDITRAVKGCIDLNCKYAIIVSMYEVYNERVYDLLDASSWEQHQQELQRQAAAAAAAAARTPSRNRSLSRPQTPAPRPKTPQVQPLPQPLPRRKNLVYRKCTSGPNRDKRAVMGLKKIYVRNMEEAILLIEHAQTCRHASSTGAASKSSRGHAFFDIDIMRMYPVKEGGSSSTGVRIRTNTFTIVDLAGSERQKKSQPQSQSQSQTKSDQVLEMGNINKNLITLGECLQTQEKMENRKPIIPPFRQSKLTELLLSNAFRAISPQKGIMIVTADPQGDYTTTLQMLRYSALASEITVPRVASTRVVSASGGPPFAAELTKNPTTPGAASGDPEDPSFLVDNELITRLVTRLEETESLFRKAEDARKSAEKQCTEALQRLVLAKQRTKEAEEQALQIEMQVREELSGEFERREKALFRAYLRRIREEEEAGREFVDRKVELAMRGLSLDGEDEGGGGGDEEGEAWERVEMLGEENEMLRREVGKLRRMLVGAGTPSLSAGKAGVVGNVGKRVGSEQARKKVAFDQ
ncbi:P-loop containing nucleoside triphosphate hydrolase protein [Tirmania nivea]|nr:P-loop containing nucleoside triphosphate hydrolase protein [Tirmania nivea]